MCLNLGPLVLLMETSPFNEAASRFNNNLPFFKSQMEPLSYYTNSGAPWFEEETERLKKHFSVEKLDILQIGKLHKRTPGGIASKLMSLGLVDSYQELKKYDEYKNSSLYKEALSRNQKQGTTVFFKDVAPPQPVIIAKPKGYIYCMSNPSMPGIMKIGMTMRTPEERLKEANKHDTFKPPTLYQIDFAKEVLNPKIKEGILHDLLERYTERINPQREFFRVSSTEVYRFFQLVDGAWWKPLDNSPPPATKPHS